MVCLTHYEKVLVWWSPSAKKALGITSWSGEGLFVGSLRVFVRFLLVFLVPHTNKNMYSRVNIQTTLLTKCTDEDVDLIPWCCTVVAPRRSSAEN